MPGCVLRVASKTSQVDDLVRVSGFTPTAVYTKGQPMVPGSSAVCQTSGFNVVVSIADSLELQVRDAVRFLAHHSEKLECVRGHVGFNGMTLDFGLHDRSSREVPWPSYRLPGNLVALAGKHGIELELSFYGRERSGERPPH